MRKTYLKAAVGAFALLLAGNAAAETKVVQRDLATLLVRCDKPVASLSIGKFSCKASACQPASNAAGQGSGLNALLAMAQAAQGVSVESFPTLGDSMSNALTTALKTTGCFTVQEREALEELRREAELAGVQLQTTPADFIVSGAITAVGLTTKSNTFGGGLLPVVGAVNKSTRQASLAVDVRLIDVKGSSVRDSRSFQAESTKSNWGIGGAGFGGSGALFGASRTTQSPEMDGVANEAVINAANFVAEALAGAQIVARPSAAAQTK